MAFDYSGLNEYDLRYLTSHLVESRRSNVAGRLLTDLGFLQAVLAKAPDDLLPQFAGTLPHLRGGDDRDWPRAAAAFRRFIEVELNTLRQHPELIIQQAANTPDASVPCQAARALLGEVSPVPWLSWVNKPQSDDPRGVVLAGHAETRSVHSNWVTACRWARDGSKLLTGATLFASGPGLRRVIEWDCNNYCLLRSWDPPGEVLGWSADWGRALVYCDGQLEVRVWPTGEVSNWISVPDGIECHDWHEGSERVLFGCRSGQLAVWSLTNGSLLTLQDAGSHVDVNCCAWSPDGTRIVSGTGSEFLRIWDANTGRQLGQLGDAHYVVEGNVTRWVTFAGHRGGANACSWSPDGRWVASGSGHGFHLHEDDFSVRLWDARTLTEVAVLSAHRDRVTSCRWSPDSNLLATTSGSVMTPGEDNSIRVWDTRTRTEIACFRGHLNEVVTCEWSPEGRRLASVSKDGTAMIWNLASAPPPTDRALGAYLSHSTRLAAVPLENHRIAMYDLATGSKAAEFTGHTDRVTTCAWSFDDSRLASGSSDRTARIWLVRENKQGPILRGHEGEDSYTAGGNRVVWGEVTDCAWAPSTFTLVTAGSDRLLIIWDGETGQRTRTLMGHIGPVERCCWTADGERVVSLGGHFEHIHDGMVKLWDPLLGAELGVLSPADRRTDGLGDRYPGTGRFTSRSKLGLVSPDGTFIIERDGEEDFDAGIRIRPLDDPDAGVTYAAGDRIACAAWFADSEHVAVGGDWITVLSGHTGVAIARFRPRTLVIRLLVSGPLKTIFGVDEGGDVYLLRCLNCFGGGDGSTGSSRCSQGRDGNREGAATGPLDPTDPEAWLRFIRGLLINETTPPGGIESCFRHLVEVDSGGDVFLGAITDPYGGNVRALNSALWAICGKVLAGDRPTALKCMRTATLHNPDNFLAWDRMGGHLAAQGELEAARDCFVRCLENNALESIAVAEALFQQLGEEDLLARVRHQAANAHD